MLPAALVLVNGPPRSGKDTLAAALRRCSAGLVERIGFADHLKRATHAAYGLDPALPFNAFEAVKDDPLPEFLGLTPRQAYIGHSEEYMKPLHGPDVFGRLFLRALERQVAPVVVAPDSGFAAEALPVLDRIGRDRVLLLRVHAEGRGKGFAGDSRSYIELPGVRTVDVWNDTEGDPALFLADGIGLVAAFLEGVPGGEGTLDALLGSLPVVVS